MEDLREDWQEIISCMCIEIESTVVGKDAKSALKWKEDMLKKKC